MHLHHQAFLSRLLGKIAPLDVAYATVEYVNRKLAATFAAVANEHNASEHKVDNEIDLKRVFTCPLSLHRSLRSVAICLLPKNIDDFDPEWTKVEAYRHWDGWDQFEDSEADGLAEGAF